MSKLRKYKTSLYELHKGLKDTISKDELEEQIKKCWKVEGTTKGHKELGMLTESCYFIGREMKVKLLDDEPFRTDIGSRLRVSPLLQTKSPIQLKHEKRYRERWLASILKFKDGSRTKRRRTNTI